MTFETPNWLTDEFIQKSLENGEKYSVKIENMKIDMPIAKGNNYVSEIFRAEVEYRKSNDLNNLQKVSLIIKSPKTGGLSEEMAKWGLTNKELRVYKELSPRFETFFHKKSDDGDYNEENILPKFYYATDDEIVVLEDLKSSGYVMVDREKQFDYKHCIVALKALAKFHAINVVLHEKEPELIEQLGKETMYPIESDRKDATNFFMKQNFKMVADEVRKIPGMEKYSKWIEESSDTIWDDAANALKPKENEFNVLNHGDFWVTNMLFKYSSDGNPESVKLIDFQASRYISPVIDFYYFIYCCIQNDVRKMYINEFISFYVEELNSNLNKSGSTVRLSEEEFINAFKEHKYYGYFVCMSVLPYVIADPNETKIMEIKDLSMDDFTDINNNPSTPYFKSKRFIEHFVKILPDFEESGLIKCS